MRRPIIALYVAAAITTPPGGALATARSRADASELASSTDLGPVTDRDMAIWPNIERVLGRITAEAVISASVGVPIPGTEVWVEDSEGNEFHLWQADTAAAPPA